MFQIVGAGVCIGQTVSFLLCLLSLLRSQGSSVQPAQAAPFHLLVQSTLREYRVEGRNNNGECHRGGCLAPTFCLEAAPAQQGQHPSGLPFSASQQPGQLLALGRQSKVAAAPVSATAIGVKAIGVKALAGAGVGLPASVAPAAALLLPSEFCWIHTTPPRPPAFPTDFHTVNAAQPLPLPCCSSVLPTSPAAGRPGPQGRRRRACSPGRAVWHRVGRHHERRAGERPWPLTSNGRRCALWPPLRGDVPRGSRTPSQRTVSAHATRSSTYPNPLQPHSNCLCPCPCRTHEAPPVRPGRWCRRPSSWARRPRCRVGGVRYTREEQGLGNIGMGRWQRQASTAKHLALAALQHSNS